MALKTGMGKLDTKWGAYVRQRDGHRCRKCGRPSAFTKPKRAGDNVPAPGRIEAHHIISRGYTKLRYAPENGLALCFTCHRWIHDNPLEAVPWLMTQLGRDFLEGLNARKGNRGGKLSKAQQREVDRKLTALLDSAGPF